MIFADPDFDLGSEQKSEYNTYVSREVAFPPLRGTQEEGKQISSMLGVQPILGKSVLENKIKNCKSPSILHMATSLFLPNEPLDMNKGNMNSSNIVKMVSWHKLQNPFLRSGLALASANNFACTQTLPKEAEDGILTS